MYEAFYVANLFCIMNTTQWSVYDDEYFIINSSWFEKWKIYTNFDFYMSRTEYFLSEKTEDKNFFETSEPYIKNEVIKTFENSYLVSNYTLYPDKINNYPLLYEKNTTFYDDEKPFFYQNYNIRENLVEGKDFIVVSKPLWNFFHSLYGGNEIKRYSVRIRPTDNVVEIKLKNLLITTTRLNKNGKLDPPKLAFFSRGDTIKQIKKQLRNIIPGIIEKDSSSKDFRLWAIDSSIPINSLEEYLLTNLQKNDREYLENIPLPAILLDVYEKNYLGEIEELINDKMIIFEDKNPSPGYYNSKNKFLFGLEKDNYVAGFITKTFIEYYDNRIDALGVNDYFKKICYCPIGFYEDYTKFDSLVKDKVDYLNNNGNKLFRIRDFFTFKYGINISQKSMFMKMKSTYSFKNFLDSIFQNEIEYIKNNIYEIYEKQDVIKKFAVFFGGIKFVSLSKKKEDLDNSKNKSFQDSMNNSNLNDKYGNSTKNSTFELDNSNHTITELNSSKDEYYKNNENSNLPLQEKVIYKCHYCNSEIEDENEIERCSICMKVNYCNDICKKKDFKFHKKKCLV